MANFAAIASVGQSLARLLTARLAEQPAVIENTVVRAAVVRTNDFDPKESQSVIQPPILSIFLYRVDFNKAMRSAWSAVGATEGRAHLPLDLHYLLTAWAGDAENEHRILGRVLQALDSTPILSGPILDPTGDWALNESVQIVMEEITTEAVMRTFDSLPTDYRLSVPYVARIVRIAGPGSGAAPDVEDAVTRVRPVGGER